MRNLYVVLLSALLSVFCFTLDAQVSTYLFSQTLGSYSSISGGTVYGSISSDDEVFVNPAAPGGQGQGSSGVGLPIGFNFNYNYVTYDRVGVNNNGWISLGQSTLTPCVNMSSNNSFRCISDTSLALPVQRNRISALCLDIQGQTGSQLRVETIGTAPNRILVLQWSNFRKYNNTGDNINFQIRLYETTNIVDVVYGTFVNNNAASNGQVGLRGTSNLDFNNRDVNSTSVWANSVAGGSYTTFAAFNSVLVPSSGLTYEWMPLPACTGTPAFNTVLVTSQLVCQGGSSNLSLSNQYNNSGITFQWLSSASISGTYNAVPTATSSLYSANTITANTWYQCVVTCTNSASSITTTPIGVNVVATTTSSVPYFESFENILVNNQLPNCSWNSSSPSTFCQTYASTPAAPVYNRIPKTGNKFASFRFGANDYFYSNGVQLDAGVTYSASVWYITDGAAGWTNFSLLYGSAQASASLTTIAATTSTLNNTSYLPLSGTFTVPSSGIYFIAVRGVGSNLPKYLTWDDLSITAPCSLNVPTYSINASSPSVCSGQSATLTAIGASTYSWSTGATTASISVTPTSSASYSLVASSSLGCVGGTVTSLISVNPLPTISIITNSATICAGQSVNQIAIGANTYTWSTGATSFSISVSPSVTTSYTVTGTNSNGCDGVTVQTIVVNPGPAVTALSSSSTICLGETAILTATGGTTYQWTESALSFSLGASIVVSPTVTTTYTVSTISPSGCPISLSITQNVSACTQLNQLQNSEMGIKIYPNPNLGEFAIEFSQDATRVIEVLDITSRLILTRVTAEKTNYLDISNFANGVYYLKIKSSNTVEVVKIIKQ